MPIGVVARQTRYFKSEYDAGATYGDLRNQLLEPVPVFCACAGQTKIGVDDVDAFDGPASDTARSRKAYWRFVLSVFSKT